ncbi:hypothetical protein A6V39_04845 [Candidatus Mycoplasma haematobovis]|uniref:DNA polymerase III delta N-terminal domain-containing protein n=1 Tax=Candidatus Mycoplasma haematobovis TaxID=432608 RepID=A0A1A9QBN9_9MOLU|nr:hypothetical protein [Candidatus Mycoplasma haematobovis]OAL09873.1 hypothetical protein A6V39_04845 [Candidatus Mycoplasma haematobovis]
MLQFYYSSDLGLLDDKAEEFKKVFPKARSIRRPTIEELNIFLLQVDLFNDDQNYIIEDFVESCIKLENFLRSIKHENLNVLFLHKVDTEIYLNNSFKELFHNKDFKVVKLTEKTKRGYIDSKLKKHLVKLPKEQLKYIKDKLPPSASVIRDFVFNLSLLGEINQENIETLLKDPREDLNYYNFFAVYLSGKDYEWMLFLNKLQDDEIKKFIHPFAHKLLDFKSYLELKIKGYSLEEIALKLGTKEYFLKTYERIYDMRGSKILEWYKDFIIELYSLLISLKYSFNTNLSLLKFFLIKKNLELEE